MSEVGENIGKIFGLQIFWWGGGTAGVTRSTAAYTGHMLKFIFLSLF